MSTNKSKLHFLETILKSNGIFVRYEKGNFHSGYCLLKDKKVAVVNKFYQTPARIRILKEICAQVFIDPTTMSEEEREVLSRIAPQWRSHEMFITDLSTAV